MKTSFLIMLLWLLLDFFIIIPLFDKKISYKIMISAVIIAAILGLYGIGLYRMSNW